VYLRIDPIRLYDATVRWNHISEITFKSIHKCYFEK